MSSDRTQIWWKMHQYLQNLKKLIWDLGTHWLGLGSWLGFPVHAALIFLLQYLIHMMDAQRATWSLEEANCHHLFLEKSSSADWLRPKFSWLKITFLCFNISHWLKAEPREINITHFSYKLNLKTNKQKKPIQEDFFSHYLLNHVVYGQNRGSSF